MRWLVVSRDRRFHEALWREAPDGVWYAAATDAAAALRVLLRERIDGAVLDAAADPGMSREFLAWWSAAAERRRMPLLVAGRAGAPGPTGARYVERDPAAVTAALGREATGVLDIGMRRLRGAGGEARLTPAEAAVVEYLLHARGPVSALDLLHGALGYKDDASLGTVRTHVGNLRRKCRRVGLDGLIRTLPRAGYYLDRDTLRARNRG